MLLESFSSVSYTILCVQQRGPCTNLNTASVLLAIVVFCVHVPVLMPVKMLVVMRLNSLDSVSVVQASVSAKAGLWGAQRSKGMRKITPSQPLGVSPKVKAHVPPAVAAAADNAGQDDSSTESMQQRLEQAFLDQYSAAEQKARVSIDCQQ